MPSKTLQVHHLVLHPTLIVHVTCLCFAALCSGCKGIHSGSRRPFTYKGTKFHRVVKSFMAQVRRSIEPAISAMQLLPAVSLGCSCNHVLLNVYRVAISYSRTAQAARSALQHAHAWQYHHSSHAHAWQCSEHLGGHFQRRKGWTAAEVYRARSGQCC